MPCRRKRLLCPGLGQDCSVCHPLGAGLGDPVTHGAACTSARRARGSEVCVMKLSSRGRRLGRGQGGTVGTAEAVWAEKGGKRRNKRDAGPQHSWYPFNPGPRPGAAAISDGKRHLPGLVYALGNCRSSGAAVVPTPSPQSRELPGRPTDPPVCPSQQHSRAALGEERLCLQPSQQGEVQLREAGPGRSHAKPWKQTFCPWSER